MKVVWDNGLYVDNGVFLDGRRKTLEKAMRTINDPYQRSQIERYMSKYAEAKDVKRAPRVTNKVNYAYKPVLKVKNPYEKRCRRPGAMLLK